MALREITISPDAIDPEDPELLQDMVTAAVNEAIRAAQELASAKLGGITGGMGGLPGDGRRHARPRRLGDVDRLQPPGHRRDGALDLTGFVSHLPVREPETCQPRRGMGLIPAAIARLLDGSAVVGEAVGLDDQTQIAPVEVDDEPIQADAGLRLGQARAPRDREEPALQLRFGQYERVAVEEVAEHLDPALPRPRGELGSELIGADQVQLVGLVDGALEAGEVQFDGEVDEGAGR